MDWDKAAYNVAYKIPSEILTVMSSIATVWGDKCFLGGGAVRDLLHGMSIEQIKDWDFYFPYHFAANDREAVGSTLARCLPEIMIWYPGMDFEPTYDSNYLTIKGKSSSYEYDFIFSGQEIKDFDHAICQCAINCKTKSLMLTEEFEWASDKGVHKIFFNNIKDGNISRVIKDHTPRILKKYPWPVIVDYGVTFGHVTY